MIAGTIVGLDPGLGTTGYGVVTVVRGTEQLVDGGCIRPPRAGPLERRLAVLLQDVGDVLDEHRPVGVAIEGLYVHHRHVRTAVTMAHARGVILVAAGQREIPVYSYPATRIKQSLTGSGRASKAQMQRMIQSRLHLAALPASADMADALAVALCHVNALRHGGAPDGTVRDR